MLIFGDRGEWGGLARVRVRVRETVLVCLEMRLPRQMMCAWMNGTRPKGRPNDTFGRRLSKTLRLKLAAFPGRAAFGNPQNEIDTWHIAAQDQSLWNAMTEQPT